jgi:hypothetical protein
MFYGFILELMRINGEKMIDDNELLLILMDIEPIVGIFSGIYPVEFSVSRIVERYLRYT